MPIVKKASPAAIAVLRQATALFPKRKRLSDGLLPSAAHRKQNPNSDHNTGLAVDLTHDPKGGVDCTELYEKWQGDDRVSYLIFNRRIWTKERGDRPYTGSNPHLKHIHLSIKPNKASEVSSWFPWLPKPKPYNSVRSKLSKKPKKKKEQ